MYIQLQAFGKIICSKNEWEGQNLFMDYVVQNIFIPFKKLSQNTLLYTYDKTFFLRYGSTEYALYSWLWE